jgi:aryl sulfotransferase
LGSLSSAPGRYYHCHLVQIRHNLDAEHRAPTDILGEPKPVLSEVSPWLDHRTSPLEPKLEKLKAQQHRRLLKSHLPLDALPYYPQVKYIVVGRDARDVFMSFWNHYSNYTDATYARLNAAEGRVGDPMPRCPQDIHECWDNWINRGWFEWESEGYPRSGNL